MLNRKRKSSVQTPPNSPQREEQYPQEQNDPFAFRLDHPLIQTMEKVDSKSFITGGEQLQAFAKLTLWLKEHPMAVDNLYFYVYSQQMDDNFTAFKQSALQAQIKEGIKLIQKMETTSKDLDLTSQSQMKKFPYPQIQKLIKPHQLWKEIKQNNLKTQIIKNEINKIIKEGIRKNKITIANLVSLLASIDAVPVNYIPIVNFNALDESNDTISKKNPNSVFLTHKILEYQGQTSCNFQTLTALSKNYSANQTGDDHAAQTAYIKELLQSYASSFNRETLTLSTEGIDLSNFFDFIFHPTCLVNKEATQYMENSKTPENYWKLFDAVSSTFSLESDDIALLYAVFSSIIADQSLPVIKFDGEGTDKEEDQLNAIQLLAITDPLEGLRFINQVGVKPISTSLEYFTSSWKEVLTYFVDYSHSDLTPSALLETRDSIRETLSE